MKNETLCASDTDILEKKKFRVFPTGVSPMTFRLVLGSTNSSSNRKVIGSTPVGSARNFFSLSIRSVTIAEKFHLTLKSPGLKYTIFSGVEAE